MATFFKRPGGWQAKIRKKGFPAQSRTFDTRAEAEAWASVIESEMVRGVFVDAGDAQKTRLIDLLDRYERDILPTKRSQQAPASIIKMMRMHALGQCTIVRLTSSALAAFRDERLKKVSVHQVRHELGLISRTLNTATREWGLTLPRGNPVQTLKLPPLPRGRDRRLHNKKQRYTWAGKTLRLTELDWILLHAREYEASRDNAGPIASLIEIAIETAMRRGELATLEWPQIDLRKRIAHLDMTKNGDRRDVPLSSHAVAILKGLKPSGNNPKGSVFGLRPDSISQAFDRVCGRAGIDDLRLHDLRHEATSRLFERGLNPMEVAAITGHKTLQMLKRYTHLRAEDLAKRLR